MPWKHRPRTDEEEYPDDGTFFRWKIDQLLCAGTLWQDPEGNLVVIEGVSEADESEIAAVEYSDISTGDWGISARRRFLERFYPAEPIEYEEEEA